ncbi:MAG: YciI family protein [Synechococcaceae cyanobacterium]
MKYVLWGTYCDDALNRRTPYREDHLAGLQRLKKAGTLLTLGPTEGSTHVFGVFEADSREQVEQLVKADVYWQQGIWTSVEVYPWIDAIPWG